MKLSYIDNGAEFDFGKTSSDYSKYRDIYPQSMYDKLIYFGIGKPSQRILDLGSGTGILPKNLYHTGAQFVSTDISENQIAYGKKMARENGFDDILFKVCSAEDTGFESGEFDAVTAIQCFHYFDAEKAAEEIFRVLKPNGLFCKIFMDWLPYEDEKIAELEATVLKHNPNWGGSGFGVYRYSFPDWANERFEIETIHSYNAPLVFTKGAWLGRVRSCRGVGAAMSDETLAEFEREYKTLLEKYTEPLTLLHQIHIEIYRRVK